jgi:1,4-alpha-glucan branching enzyme
MTGRGGGGRWRPGPVKQKIEEPRISLAFPGTVLGIPTFLKELLMPTSSYKMQELGAFPVKGGTKFRVWALDANDVKLNLYQGNASTSLSMTDEGCGFWSVVVPGVQNGQAYTFEIDGAQKSDPLARNMVHSADKSLVHLDTYSWKHNNFRMAPWHELVIYQLHCGTYPDKAPQAGDLLKGIIDELWYLQKLGINAIQLLPTSEFPTDISWGYNPSSIFAVEAHYGGPDALKAFVDAAHGKDIAVFLDVVYNHLSPDGAMSLWQFTRWHQKFIVNGAERDGGGVYFYNDWRACTPWGDRPDYGRPEVRDYLRDNAMMWLTEYRIDGLRFDSVVNIRNARGNNNDPAHDLPDGWRLLQEINGSVKQEQLQGRNVITIAEDLQGNEWITREIGAGGAGFGAQWDAFFLHNSRDTLLKVRDEDRDMFLMADILRSRYGTDAFQRIVAKETHDEAAANNGKRRLTDAIGQGNVDTNWFVKKRVGLGAAITMTAPGIPMLLQGEEVLEWRPFGDVRDTNGVDWNRFCPVDDDCRTCMDRKNKCVTATGEPCNKTISCSECPLLIERCEPEGQFSGIFSLYRDLIRLRRNWFNNTRGLRGQHLNVSHINNADKLLAYHRWENGGPGDDVVVVLNFANRSYPKYTIGFPKEGMWQLRLNSDGNAYDPSFGNFFSYDTEAQPGRKDGLDFAADIGIGPYSALIFSQ